MEATALSGMEFVQSLAVELTTGKLELPAFPDAAEKVRRALDDSNCSPDRLTRVIGADASLAAHVMKMANSALYNPRGFEIANLQIAIGRLGHDTIRSAAVAMAMRQLSSASATPALKEPLGQLWKHSVQVAAVAHCLAKRAPRVNQDEAMLAGLVHDIGELYILKRAAEDPRMLDDDEALQTLINDWHAGVGRAIVDAWGFPESVVIAVDEHEELERDLDVADVTSAVLVANLIARVKAGELPDLDWEKVPSFAHLGLTTDTLDEVLRESADEIKSIIGALKA